MWIVQWKHRLSATLLGLLKHYLIEWYCSEDLCNNGIFSLLCLYSTRSWCSVLQSRLRHSTVGRIDHGCAFQAIVRGSTSVWSSTWIFIPRANWCELVKDVIWTNIGVSLIVTNFELSSPNHQVGRHDPMWVRYSTYCTMRWKAWDWMDSWPQLIRVFRLNMIRKAALGIVIATLVTLLLSQLWRNYDLTIQMVDR